jgi:hypothetical protein
MRQGERGELSYCNPIYILIHLVSIRFLFIGAVTIKGYTATNYREINGWRLLGGTGVWDVEGRRRTSRASVYASRFETQPSFTGTISNRCTAVFADWSCTRNRKCFSQRNQNIHYMQNQASKHNSLSIHSIIQRNSTYICYVQAHGVAMSLSQQFGKSYDWDRNGKERNGMLWDGGYSAPRSCLFLPGAWQPAYKCEGRSCLGRTANIPQPPPPPPTCQPEQLLHQPAVVDSMHACPPVCIHIWAYVFKTNFLLKRSYFIQWVIFTTYYMDPA